MRISVSALLIFSATLSFGQLKKAVRVSGVFDNAPLEAIFDSLSSQTDYFFSYNSELLPKGSLFVITADNEPIDQFLSRLFVGTGLKYSFFKDQIILNYEPPEEINQKKNLFSISGVVYDESGKPLSDVNIFLDGTSIGTSSNKDGVFLLESIQKGSYDLVFSHIGYNNKVYQISEQNGGARIQNHQMELDTEQLNQVEVTANRIVRSDNSWLAHYMIFVKELVGLTKNADYCIVENPESIKFFFDRQNNTLRAFADEPIQIRNDALGYRVSYFLESFEKVSDGDLRFRGRIRFRNLEPMSGAEKRQWKRNRKESYYGSFNHFKQSLIAGELKKEGFRLYQLKDINEFEINKSKTLSERDIVVFKGDNYEMDFDDYLIVEYRKEKESLRFLENSGVANVLYPDRTSQNGLLVKDPGHQVSIIRLLRGSVSLDLSGEVMDKFGLTTFGYWSWERTADLVPINYNPKNDNL